ncbi:MAG TPA: substrate-binding domain-containing protein [Streptosporangiaceae bacterium]|nr:substrate-binding domain-containing protein [Streptosporangiaceae bacterium]
MRTFTKLLAAAATAATAAAMAAAPAAMADPPAGATVHRYDVAGIGADTTESLFDQFSADYNAAQKAAHKTDSASSPYLYSWDATNPSTGAINDNIVLKQGCKAIERPDGSSAGIAALTAENAKDGTVGSGKSKRTAYCIDFVRSARNRSASDPVYGKGGVAFITLAGDAITYATQPKSDAPSSLTIAQLYGIYTCKYTNWKQVGGKNAPIKAFIPESGSGIRSSFLTAIGFPSSSSPPGTCVSDGATKQDPGGRLQQNEGVSSLLNGADKAEVIVPYAVSKYLAQVYHSAKCLNHFCDQVTTGTNKGKVCLPSATQDQFGCDEHGSLELNEVSKTAPATPWPLPSGSCTTKCPVESPSFTPLLQISQYAVVPYSTSTGSVNGIAPYLLPLFGPKGYLCTSKLAKTDLEDYGFRVFKAGTATGHSITLCGDTH